MRLEALGREFRIEFRFCWEIDMEQGLSWEKAIHLCWLVLRLTTVLRGPADSE